MNARTLVGLKVLGLAAALLVMVASVSVASACPVFTDGGVAVRIEAFADGQTAVFEQTFPTGAGSESQYLWELPSEVQLKNAAGQVLGILKNLELTYDLDPGVSLAFEVTSMAFPTTFNIQSSVINFATVRNPLAYASAAVTVTDINHNGATLTGLFPGSEAYQARYNSNSIFANMIGATTAEADDSAYNTERIPGSGRVTIYDDLSSIESQFRFSLSANDTASGSSRFDVTGGIPVVPEPATMALLGIGGIGVLLKRRRNAARTKV